VSTSGIIENARLQDVQVKARFGHKDWIYWRQRDGSARAEWKTPESVKRALLACGTRGFWCLVQADSGTPMKGFWAMGLNLIKQSKYGF
jgi:hypothetical protein